MKFLFNAVLFLIFFNIGAFMIASIGFFPSVIYGDLVGDTWGTDLENPNTLPTPTTVFNNLLKNSQGEAFSVGVGSEQTTISFWMVTVGILGLAVALTFITKSPQIVAVVIVGAVFYFMYWNSKRSLESLAGNLDANVQYVALMVGIGMLVVIVLTVMDYLSGQSSAGGKSH